jgi:hypothetical protein
MSEWTKLCNAVEAYVDHPVGAKMILQAAYDYAQAVADDKPGYGDDPHDERPQPPMWPLPEGVRVKSASAELIELVDAHGNPRPEDWIG